MNSDLYSLLQYHSLKLLLARDQLILKDEFETDLCGWMVFAPEGDPEKSWHVMTVDTNEDKSAGLDGKEMAIQTFGAWAEGTAEKTVVLENYAEITFEHYVKNDPLSGRDPKEHNFLRFYVDDQLKLEVKGPSPWYRCAPIGLTPGEHVLKFEYELPKDKDRSSRKGVVDTILLHEARDVRCLITKYTPPYATKSLSKVSILRGFSAYQEMTESDTKIEFTAAFEGIDFHDFMTHSSNIFYFVDEFGVCYRGLFDGEMGPESVALGKNYAVELTMIAGQRTGIGFC